MNNLDLNSVKWEPVKISSIFHVRRGNAKNISKKTENGQVALLSAKDSNNAYNFSVKKEKKETSAKDCITINNNGSVAYAFYHPYEFISTSDVTILTSKENISKEAKMFVVTILNKLKVKYSYGYKMSNDRIKQQKIMLPIDEKGNPHWAFMEKYIKSKYEIQRNKIIEFLAGGGYNYTLSKPTKWKRFFIGGSEGIFEIRSTNSGIDKNKLNMEAGKIPYITRSGLNNGINLFVNKNQKEKYKIDQGNVITIGLDTQTVFYQKSNFFTGQNIQILKNDNINEKNALFIIALLKKQLAKFSWGGNGATLARLNRSSIMLPVDDNENPDWDFMEKAGTLIENSMKEKVVEFLTNRTL